MVETSGVIPSLMSVASGDIDVCGLNKVVFFCDGDFSTISTVNIASGSSSPRVEKACANCLTPSGLGTPGLQVAVFASGMLRHGLV